MKIAILALTDTGLGTARKLADGLVNATVLPCRNRLAATLEEAWREYQGLVCIMALGIAVRLVAPLLRDKYTDPALVVCDETGSFAISVLSGHLGGANELARQVAGILQGQAVITTASDVHGHTALDIWLRNHGLVVSERKGLTRLMGRLLDQGFVTFYSEVELDPLPPDIRPVPSAREADLVITWKNGKRGGTVTAYPRILVAGIGCNRHTPAAEIEQAVRDACRANNLAFAAIGRLASIDLKQNEEGLLEFAENNGYPIDFFHRDQLNRVPGIAGSEVVFRATGAKGVAEPAAILAARGPLLVRKMKWKNVTVAIALRQPVDKDVEER